MIKCMKNMLRATGSMMLHECIKKSYAQQETELPVLTDYAVRIPPGGKSDALCETIITWSHNGKEFKTRGLDRIKLFPLSKPLKKCEQY